MNYYVIQKLNSTGGIASMHRLAIKKMSLLLLTLLLLTIPYQRIAYSKDEISVYDAALNGDTNKVSEFLTQGGDPNSMSEDGRSLLCLASYGGTSIIKLLLDHKANVNIRNNDDGETPLHCAASSGHREIGELLISGGADVNALGNNGKAPLFEATEYSYKDFVGLLLDHGAKWDIYSAILMGNMEKVEEFIRDGADVNEVNDWAPTPLAWAVRQDREEIVKYFVSHGACLHACKEVQETPLSYALQDQRKELARFLINSGADVNLISTMSDDENIDYATPLDQAIELGWKDIAELLIEKGADINGQSNGGGVPLIGAVLTGNEEIILMLIKHGANVRKADMDHDFVRYAIEQANEADLAHKKSFITYKNIANILINNGADISRVGDDGCTILSLSALYGYKEIADLLLGHGADIHARCSDGETPLHFASDFGGKEITAFLIAHGADVNAKANNGMTPLYLAARKGNADIVESLLRAGADVNMKSFLGRTALTVAVIFKDGADDVSRYDRTIKILRKYGAK